MTCRTSWTSGEHWCCVATAVIAWAWPSRQPTWRAVQAACPERTRVNTQNAELNAPMVAINEKMGFRPVELALEFQRIVSAEVEIASPTVAAGR